MNPARIERPKWGSDDKPRPATVHSAQRGGLQPKAPPKRNAATPNGVIQRPRRQPFQPLSDLEKFERWCKEEEHAILLASERAERWRQRAAAAEVAPKPGTPSRFHRT